MGGLAGGGEEHRYTYRTSLFPDWLVYDMLQYKLPLISWLFLALCRYTFHTFVPGWRPDSPPSQMPRSAQTQVAVSHRTAVASEASSSQLQAMAVRRWMTLVRAAASSQRKAAAAQYQCQLRRRWQLHTTLSSFKTS